MTTRIQPWTEPELMDRESVFENLVEKALIKTMRALASEVREGILTAAATLPVDPTTEGAYATAQGAVMASWTTQVDATLYPFLTSTFTDSAARVVDGVQAASGIVVDQLTGVYADEVLQYAYNRMVGIGESLWLNIRDQLVEGYTAGESIPQIAERLTQVAGLTTPRALTVARTEIISAANNGSYLQMLDAGFDEAVTKVWLATEDTRTRLSHRHADNQGVDLTGEFNVDIYSGDVKTGTEPMEFPGDPTATPGNIINCRCSLAFDFEEDAEEVLVSAAAFTEKDHPRDKDGKFKKKGAADKFVPDAGDSDYVKNAKGKAKSITNLFTIHKTSMTAAKAADIVQNLEPKAWDLLDDDIKDMLEKKALGNKVKKVSTEAKLKALKEGNLPPSNNASKFEKIDWIVKNKWDSLPVGQKATLIKNLDEDIWSKLPETSKDKIKDAPGQTSHPEAQKVLEDALEKIQGFQDEPDDDADTDTGKRALGGIDTKTGKALVPGKPVKLRVQILYNTKFEDGAIMAVRKDSGERIIWNEKTKKIERQKLSAAGKYETTEALSRGAAYAAWKDEDGWTVPDASDFATPEATTSAPQTPSVAVGKPVKIKVQLIYQTPFDDGDIVAVNPSSGDVIKWDAKKKRMVVHHAKGGTTEYTRGALYKEYKDSDGWHLPADKKAAIPAPAPVKKAVPPAKSAKPVSTNVKAGPAKGPGAVADFLKAADPKGLSPLTKKAVPAAAPPAPDPIKDFLGLSQMQKNKIILSMSQKDWDGLSEAEQKAIVKDADHWDEDLPTDAAVDHLSELVKGAKPKAVPAPAKEPVSDYEASEDSHAIYQAWDTGMPGEIWNNGPFSVGLAKNGNLLFLDSKPGGGVGVVKAADVNSENIDKALEAVMAGKTWTVDDAIPEVGPDEINAPGPSQSVSAGQDPSLLQFGDGEVDDFKDTLQESDTFVGDTIFENDAVKLFKENSSGDLGVLLKSNGKTATIDWDVVDSDHLHDTLELMQEDATPSVPVSAQTQDIFDAYKKSPLGLSELIYQDSEIKVKKPSSGNLMITSEKDIDLLGGLYAADVTPANLEKAIAAVKAGKDFGYGEPIPDVPDVLDASPLGEFPDFMVDIIKNQANDSGVAALTSIFDDGNVEILKGGGGNIAVMKKGGQGLVGLGPDQITKAGLEKAYVDAMAGVVAGPKSTAANAVTPDKAATIKDWAKQGDIPAGEELHNGANFKIVKGAPGAIIIYPKGPDGHANTNSGTAQFLFGDEITSQGIENTLSQMGLTGGGVVSPVVAPAAANVTVTNKPLTSPATQLPLKMSYGLLVNPKTTNYKDGQIIAENPSQGERLVWDGIAKKYLVQLNDGAGNWIQVDKYSKQGAYKNLKDDPGWVTPSAPFVTSNSGDTPGTAPTPSIAGAPVAPGSFVQPQNLAQKVSSGAKPPSLFGPDPKMTISQLQQKADSGSAVLTQAQKNNLFSTFKSKGGNGTVYLSSSEKEQFEGLLETYVSYTQANPGSKLSLLQILRVVDEVSAKNANVTNNNSYENKVIAWLTTPAGTTAAQNIAKQLQLNAGSDKKVLAYNNTLAKFQETSTNRAQGTASYKTVAKIALDNQSGIKAHTPGQQYPQVMSVAEGSAIAAEMRAKYGPLSDVAKKAMQEYTGSSYVPMNDYMRSFGKSSNYQATRSKQAEAGMKPITRAITVHRNVGTVFDTSWTPTLEQLKDFVGVTFREDAFASTSIAGNAFNGQKYRFIIEIPEGTPLQWVQTFSQVKSEDEFLLGSGLHYEILSVHGPNELAGPWASTSNKTAVIKMRVVPPPADAKAQLGVKK